MHGDLKSRNMNNGKKSNKDNPKFRNLKVNNKDNLSNPNNSILNLRASNIRGNHNTNILKENLKEGVKSTESRMTKSLETLPSIISVG